MCLILSPNLWFTNIDPDGVIAKSEAGEYFNIGSIPLVLTERDSKFASITDSFKPVLHDCDGVEMATVHSVLWTKVNDVDEIKQIFKVCKFPMLATPRSELYCCKIRIPRHQLMKTKRHIIKIEEYVNSGDFIFVEIKDIGKGDYFEGVIIKHISHCKALPSIFLRPYYIFERNDFFFFNGHANNDQVLNFVYKLRSYDKNKSLTYASRKLGIQLQHVTPSRNTLRNSKNRLLKNTVSCSI